VGIYIKAGVRALVAFREEIAGGSETQNSLGALGVCSRLRPLARSAERTRYSHGPSRRVSRPFTPPGFGCVVGRLSERPPLGRSERTPGRLVGKTPEGSDTACSRSAQRSVEKSDNPGVCEQTASGPWSPRHSARRRTRHTGVRGRDDTSAARSMPEKRVPVGGAVGRAEDISIEASQNVQRKEWTGSRATGVSRVRWGTC